MQQDMTGIVTLFAGCQTALAASPLPRTCKSMPTVRDHEAKKALSFTVEHSVRTSALSPPNVLEPVTVEECVWSFRVQAPSGLSFNLRTNSC